MDRIEELPLTVAGEAVVLRGDRSLYWPRERLLAVSDLHIGKVESLRSIGVPLPDGVMYDDLVRLAAAVEETHAERLVIIGDLIHDAAGLTASVVEAFARWRAQVPVALTLVLGNHDLRVRQLPADWSIASTVDALHVGPFAFAHERLRPDAFTWQGHLHPVVAVGAGSDRVRLPCFHVHPYGGVLPAFCTLTGGSPVERDRHARDLVVGVAAGRVFRIPR